MSESLYDLIVKHEQAMGGWACECSDLMLGTSWEKHLATVIAEHVREMLAEAWDDGCEARREWTQVDYGRMKHHPGPNPHRPISDCCLADGAVR